jgi:hypothetical protein
MVGSGIRDKTSRISNTGVRKTIPVLLSFYVPPSVLLAYVLFRFLQSKYGQAESQKYLSAIMRLVLTLLADH